VAPSTLVKWGIILGVQKDIQIVARVPLNLEPLEGCIVCVDIVVPSLSSFSTSFIHHVFISSSCLLDSEISTDPTWVPGSDHRAIKAKFMLKSSVPNFSTVPSTLFVPSMPLPPPRIKYLSKDDKYKFLTFQQFHQLCLSRPCLSHLLGSSTYQKMTSTSSPSL
jgi:hypothetical protein